MGTMREIKFRGRRLDTGQWVYGDFVSTSCSRPSIDAANGLRYAVDPDTLGQYTGRKDSLGKEVFEGDVIRVNGKVDKIVEYREAHCAFCLANVQDCVDADVDGCWDIWQSIYPVWWDFEGREIIVVGNKHEGVLGLMFHPDEGVPTQV